MPLAHDSTSIQKAMPRLCEAAAQSLARRIRAALAENPIRPKIGLDWTYTMLPSWILTVYPGINLQPS